MVRSHSAAVSHLPRTPMNRAALSVVALFNTSVAAEEQDLSRQLLFYLQSSSVNRKALRRLEHVPEGRGAEAWRRFVEHYELVKARRGGLGSSDQRADLGVCFER